MRRFGESHRVSFLDSGIDVAPVIQPMPHRALRTAKDLVLHVHNRSVRRHQLFFDDGDYQAFERVLVQALERVPVSLLAYCVMPNHWHLVVHPSNGDLPRFMHWLTMTHAKRWHLAHGSLGTGPVYQNRYGAVPVQTETHLLTLLRYVERNPLRAQLVRRAEDWRWGSLWRRCNSCDDLPLTAWPIPQPVSWLETINHPQTESELKNIQEAVAHGRPIGHVDWAGAIAKSFQIPMANPGRPKRHRV
jgi:putative transposase